jgi:NAD(P)-dependent dehydrogenase (short-subunit alcohol dehydrogenase family)
MSINLTGRVAIVTGAGGGLGRAHALLLARLGAKVVVNDLHNGARVAAGAAPPAETVVKEITAAGGEAIASNCSVTDFEQVQKMVADTVDRWGKIDILVNNAGILRDKTFAKMDLADFRLVLDVHLMGSVHCTKAVWDLMRAQN